MDIFFHDTLHLLPTVTGDTLPNAGWPVEWFWIVHPTDVDAFLADRRGAVDTCLSRGGAILFVSTSPRCALAVEDAENREDQHSRRIRFLRVGCSLAIESRFQQFLSYVGGLRAWDEVRWEKAEPEPWPPFLVALYLLCHAISPERSSGEMVVRGWKGMDTPWKEEIWSKAKSEYDVRADSARWEAAGLPVIRPGAAGIDLETVKPAEAITVIGSVFPKGT